MRFYLSILHHKTLFRCCGLLSRAQRWPLIRICKSDPRTGGCRRRLRSFALKKYMRINVFSYLKLNLLMQNYRFTGKICVF